MGVDVQLPNQKDASWSGRKKTGYMRHSSLSAKPCSAPCSPPHLVCLVYETQQLCGCLHACCQHLLVVQGECDVLLQKPNRPAGTRSADTAQQQSRAAELYQGPRRSLLLHLHLHKASQMGCDILVTAAV